MLVKIYPVKKHRNQITNLNQKSVHTELCVFGRSQSTQQVT